jgi:hypothetical protein
MFVPFVIVFVNGTEDEIDVRIYIFVRQNMVVGEDAVLRKAILGQVDESASSDRVVAVFFPLDDLDYAIHRPFEQRIGFRLLGNFALSN